MTEHAQSRMGRIAKRAAGEISTARGSVILVVVFSAGLALLSDVVAAQIIGVLLVVAIALGSLALSGELRAARQRSEVSPPPASSGKTGSTRGYREGSRPEVSDRLSVVVDSLGLVTPEVVSRPADSGLDPLVSIIIPVFNDGDYVDATLESVKRQTYRRWECVVVDDASTDSSWERINSATSGDARFRVLQNEANSGPGAARNRAIAEARGDYIVFLDGDDLLLGRSLSDRVEALASAIDDPYVIGSFCGVRFSPEDVALDQLADRYSSAQKPFVDFVSADGEAPFTMIAPLVSTDRIRSIGGLDESMTTGGVDWDLWYRILRNGHVFVSSPFQGAVYRQRPGGITRGNPAAHTAAAAKLIEAAHDHADPAVLIEPTPYPMLEPIGAYQARLKVAERATRFAAMALVDGDHEGMNTTLTVLDQGTWPLLNRHLDLSSLVARGAARALGVRAQELEGHEDDLAPFVLAVRTALKKVTT